MRIGYWNPNKADSDFSHIVMTRLTDAADVIADELKHRVPIGTVSRPAYKTGKYAGKKWTSREPGRLRKTVRVVRKKTKKGNLSRKKNVRVYVGDYLGYYALIVEHEQPYFRPALAATMGKVKDVIGVK